MFFKIALRNIWRNKRRTLITMAAVAFAVFLSSVMISIQKGAWDNVINTSVTSFVGFAQVHAQGYWDEKSLDKSMHYEDQLKTLPSVIDNIQGVTPRLESFALASADNYTQGVLVVGMDPISEDALTKISEKIILGKYLSPGDSSCLVAEGVAQKLKLKLGDTLVLISQGYRGANAAGKYAISGILKFPLPDMNKRLVYLDMPVAQYFYAAPDRVTSVAMNIEHSSQVDAAVVALKEKMDNSKYEVMDYEEMLPELVQARQLDEGGGVIVLGILYTLITFAILGTILMMTKERSYEFGVLTAIGMKRGALFSIVWLETILVALLGVLLGILLAMPVVHFLNPIDMSAMGEEAVAAYDKFGMEPIIPVLFSPKIFLNQAKIIFIVTCILALYPFFKIMNLNPVSAMRE